MMELYKELLVKILESSEINITFTGLHIDATEILSLESYKALQKIKAIIEDDSLDDEECFMKVEKIVCLKNWEVTVGCATILDSKMKYQH